jgi:UDP-3-O-[3-hydroxymyristoyl] glucosamine N-acyltransferase
MLRQGYIPWMREGGRIAAFDAGDAYFAEHSLPPAYLASNLALLGGAKLRHPPGRLRGVDPTASIHSTAVIRQPVQIGAGAHVGEGATVGPHAVIGARAVVDAGATIERAVVWPRARVSGGLRDAIATWDGVVAIEPS